ncbi:MAG: hypothetical protein SNJ74_06320 [Fimbriimonadaceae bacterium]
MAAFSAGAPATAWSVAFKPTPMGLRVAGTAIGRFPTRIRAVGKPISHFGLIFFASSHVSADLGPLLDRPWVVEAPTWAKEPGAGLGLLLAAVIHTGMAVVGLPIVLVAEKAVPPEAAISVEVGLAFLLALDPTEHGVRSRSPIVDETTAPGHTPMAS